MHNIGMWQQNDLKTIFSNNFKRSALLSIKLPSSLKATTINVHRNHAFEMSESALPPFLAYAGLKADFRYSAYDDSLSFTDLRPADLELLWVDVDRYHQIDITAFLEERLKVLHNLSKAPVLAVITGDFPSQDAFLSITSSTVWVEVKRLLKNMREAAFDLTKEPFTGTRLSNKACLKLSQILGLQYIPALLTPSVKLVVTDLDNTLYEGILGEDGAAALKMTPAHEALQQKIKALKRRGFFIAVASKNELQDVERMFQERTDFPLQIKDFDALKINWNNKAENISEICKQLNIGTDTALFIDDNPAEIQNISLSGLGTRTIMATSPEYAQSALSLHPGLMKLALTEEDRLRSQDAAFNAERHQLAQLLTVGEYRRKLGLRLTFAVNPKQHLTRIAELLGKTNQFIFNYKRHSPSMVEQLMNEQDSCVVTASMADNLSDSGLIAILIAKNISKRLEVDEAVVSCRALGRKIETPMLLTMLSLAKQKLGCQNSQMAWPYEKGPRNQPALDWLASISGQKLNNIGAALIDLQDEIETDGLEIIF